MLIIALFTVAKTSKQHKCPSTEEWLKKLYILYIYNVYIEHYSAIKKNEMSFVAKWMDSQIITLSEVSQKEKDKHCMISLTCGILIKGKNELTCRTETDSQTLKTNLW